MITHSPLDVVVSGTGSDSHTWNLDYLQLLLEGWGHRVENLGPRVTGKEIVARCRYRAPDLIVLSSVDGHGESDGLRAISALHASRALAGTPVVIVGEFGTHGAEDRARDEGSRTARRLLAAGFAAVFLEPAGLEAFKDFVGLVTPRAHETLASAA
ncbi:cobalamin B12-binding domain-containing protein [Streptomyces sp. NPDC002537]